MQARLDELLAAEHRDSSRSADACTRLQKRQRPSIRLGVADRIARQLAPRRGSASSVTVPSCSTSTEPMRTSARAIPSTPASAVNTARTQCWQVIRSTRTRVIIRKLRAAFVRWRFAFAFARVDPRGTIQRTEHESDCGIVSAHSISSANCIRQDAASDQCTVPRPESASPTAYPATAIASRSWSTVTRPSCSTSIRRHVAHVRRR